MKIFDDTFRGLERAMDLRSQRHAVLASNVANSDTPSYRARELDFAGQLQQALGQGPGDLNKTNPLHMDLVQDTREHIVLDKSAPMGADGNNVDIDIQMGKISENGRAYDMAAQLLGKKFSLIRQFIRRGAM